MGVWLVLLLENAASMPITVDFGSHYVRSISRYRCETHPTTLKGAGITGKRG